MRVVIYARYSSEKQNENTIEAQLRYCREYCQRNDHTIVREYIDRATSASTHIEKRTQFLRMIKDSDKKQFDAVLVFKLDRFSRNRYDSATYKNKLKKNNVVVLSATENLSGNKESIILESVLEGMAEYFSKDLSEKVTSGMRERALQCCFLGGVVPLGYKIVDSKFVLNDEEAPFVLEAFERYSKGAKMIDICRDFNLRGFKTRRGSEFVKNSLQNMFTNERYKGTYVFQDIIIPHGIPSIVSDELWEKCNHRVMSHREDNRDIGGRAYSKVEYLLSGKLYCGKCGAVFHGDCGTSKNGVYYYYTCSNRRSHNTCDMPRLKKDEIEDIVCQRAIEFLDDDAMNFLIETITKTIDEYNSQDNSSQLQDQIKEVEKKINNVVIAIQDYQSKVLVDKLRELEYEKKSLERDLKATEKDKIILPPEAIRFFLEQIKIFKDEDINERRRLVDILVDKVTYYEDGSMDIEYNLEKMGFRR